MQAIDDCIATLRSAGIRLEVEDDVAGFLGVHIDQKYDGKIVCRCKFWRCGRNGIKILNSDKAGKTRGCFKVINETI
jgi:hypothetical protein